MIDFAVMALLLMLTLAFAPGSASPGAALAGLGGVGVGLRGGSGELEDNPAASAFALGFDEGVVSLGASWARLTFSGYAFNAGVTTTRSFDVTAPTGFGIVTPRTRAGRLALGLWEVEHRALELTEPLDRGLVERPGAPAPLSATYESGNTRLRQDEALHAAGACWIAEFADGDARLALGGAWLSGLARDAVEVEATRAADGAVDRLRKVETRRTLEGPAAIVGVLYRPVPEGSVGLRVMHAGVLKGRAWTQAAGGALYRDDVSRPAQERVGLGGAVTFWQDLTLAADLEFLSEIRGGATLFRGTPLEGYADERSEVAIQSRMGVEWPLKLARGTLPLRAGFFIRQDPLPATVRATASAAVQAFAPASFKQDVTGWTVGTGWSGGALRADLALEWLLVTTHVKQRGPSGVVDFGDTRNGLAAVASVTLVFGRRAAE